MAAALVATEAYKNTVVPDTANTSVTNPTGGSYKTVVVGSNTTKRHIDPIYWEAEGDITTATEMFFGLYDSGSGKAVWFDTVVLNIHNSRLDKLPIVPTARGFVPIPDFANDLPDNTWSIIVWIYASQAIRVNGTAKGYS